MKFRSVVAGLVALGVLAGSQSCKPVRSEQAKPTAKEQKAKEQEALSNKVASGLQVNFYLADEKGFVPDFDRPAPSHLMEGAMRDGQVIQLKKRVGLNSEKLFLAISDSVGDRRITGAYYEYHSISPSNSIQGNRPPERLNRDENRHELYMAMDQLKEQSREPLSSLDLQILDISLNFNDGTDSHLELRFYVKGELPSLEQVRMSQTPSEPQFSQLANAPKLTAQEISRREGWTVLTERYKNPLARPLTLWFTAKDVSFQLLTQLGMKVDQKAATTAPDNAGFEIGPKQFSIAPLDRVRLVMKDVLKGGSQDVFLRKDGMTPIQVNPGQTLEIEWQVLASEDAPLCKDGAPVTWTYHGCGDPDPNIQIRLKAFENPDCPRIWGSVDARYPVPVTGIWSVQSYKVIGHFNNSAVLTEVIGSQEKALHQAVQEGLAIQAQVTTPSPSQSEGFKENTVSPVPVPLASCQGIY
jgi:hypothetical protein